MQQNLHPDKRATAVRDFYETHGAAFAATRQAPWGIFELVKKALKPGDALIDVGAGNARLASILPDAVQYIGIEPSSTLRQAARPFIASRLNAEMRDGGFTVGDPAQSLPVRNAEADVVACFAVLHHIPTRRAREQAVAELARMLKPGGTAVVTVWNLRSTRFAQFKIWLAAWMRLPMIAGGEGGDVWVPWKANGENALRYVHAFTLREFRLLFDERLWKIQLCEAWGNDAPTGILKARNLVIVAERK